MGAVLPLKASLALLYPAWGASEILHGSVGRSMYI